MTIELPELAWIDQVATHLWNGNPDARYGFWLAVSANGDTWRAVTDRKADDGMKGTVVDRFPPVAAKFVRLHATLSNLDPALSVLEMEVFGYSAKPE